MKKDLVITSYVDDSKNQIEEVEWLYKSYIYSGNHINSDIILFCNPTVIPKLNRHILNDNNVKIIPLKPISKKDKLWNDYPFINSIYYLTTKEAEIVNKYDYILRTDNDVFLTENLVTLRPDIFMFGMGRYIKTEEEQNNIIRVIKSLNLKYDFIHNVGSTILHRVNKVLEFTKYQFNICKHLKLNEFSNFTGKWPGWFKGVLTMYAGEITANQYGNTYIRTNVLDSYSMSVSKISNNYYHIHAYHTEQYFSKHKYRKGDYDNIKTEDLNLDIINDYCLFIAKSSIEDIVKNKKYNIYNGGISIVMTYHDRRELLIRTLDSINKSLFDRNKLEIIIVNDASSKEHQIDDLKDVYKELNLKIINIKEKQKKWTNSCVPYNIGFNYIKYDKVIIQNPECYHNGDILTHVSNNLNNNNYLSYGCYSLTWENTRNYDYENVEINNHKNDKATSDGWYNHSTVNPTGYHFCSSITYTNLSKLNGFEERYKDGIGYDDNEWVERVKKMGLDFKIIDNPFVFHQAHPSVFRFNDSSPEEEKELKRTLFKKNQDLFLDVTKKENGYRAENNTYFNVK